MAVIETINEANPLGTDNVSDGDNEFRTLKKAIRERMDNGGHEWQDNTVNAQQGRHVLSDIYKSDTTTVLVDYADALVTINEDLTVLAGKTLTADGVTSGNDPGHKHHVTLVIPLPITTTGRIPGPVFTNRGNGTLEVVEAQLQCWTAPTVGAETVKITKLAGVTTATNPASASGTDVTFGTGNPTIAVGSFYSDVETTASGGHQLAVGDAWVFDCTAHDSGAVADINLILKVLRD